MPELERPDGARIHHEVRGDGPLVVLSLGYAATPAVYEALIAELARDRRVLTWHPRGCGESSREGPYDLDTDAGDLLALIEQAGGSATLFGAGHGVNVSARASFRHPAGVRAFATPGVVAALRDHVADTEGFASSDTVTQMLVEQLRRDPRAAVRATLASLNPQLDDEGLRARVDETLAYTDVEVTLARVEAWRGHDTALEELRALGGRLTVMWHHGDAWQTGAIGRAAELLPEAKIVEVEDGPLSRPDLAANIVRELG